MSAMGKPSREASTTYTCPMDPDIRSDQPGACPKCGMALEPRTVTTEELENPELRDMTRRFWVGVALTVPVFAMAMAVVLPRAPRAGRSLLRGGQRHHGAGPAGPGSRCARSRTRSAIRALLGLSPKTARPISDDGTEADVPLEQVQVGQRLRVRPGDRRIDGQRRAPSPSRRRRGTR